MTLNYRKCCWDVVKVQVKGHNYATQFFWKRTESWIRVYKIHSAQRCFSTSQSSKVENYQPVIHWLIYKHYCNLILPMISQCLDFIMRVTSYKNRTYWGGIPLWKSPCADLVSLNSYVPMLTLKTLQHCRLVWHDWLSGNCLFHKYLKWHERLFSKMFSPFCTASDFQWKISRVAPSHLTCLKTTLMWRCEEKRKEAHHLVAVFKPATSSPWGLYSTTDLQSQPRKPVRPISFNQGSLKGKYQYG